MTNIALMLVALTFANLGAANSSKPTALWINSHQIPTNQIYVYQKYPFDLPFYLQAPIKIISDNWQDPSLLNKDSWRGEFAYGLQQTPGAKQNFVNQADFMTTWSSKQPMYVLVDTKRIPIFQSTVGTDKLTQLMTSKQWTLVTNIPAN